MNSVFKSGICRLALLAALGFAANGAPQASAADLGGDCCADLEERIAELEATTARKGNRKVKLEVSGHVNEAVLYWDDGIESNVGVYTNDNARTRFRFKGDAKIADGWKAGYLLEIGVRSANSKRFDQDNDNANAGTTTTDNGLDIRHSVWFVESKTYGKLWVGLTGGASEGVTEVNLSDSKDIAKYSDVEDSGLGLRVRADGQPPLGIGGSDTQWRNLIRGGGDQPGEGTRHNLVRYDTPEIMGFTGTANWGEDDNWEAGLRYKGELGDFKLAAGIAYGENSDGTGRSGFQCVGNNANGAAITATLNDTDCEQLGGSISVMHEPTGIYGNFAAGYLKDNAISSDPGLAANEQAIADDRSEFYAAEIGIQQKWTALGKTTVFGQYYLNEGGTQDRTLTIAGVADNDILESELESFGGGIIQGIDAAAMHLYLTYRHYEGEATTLSGTTQLEDLDVVMSGALIKF